MPATPASGTGWPFGTGGADMPHITISSARTFTQKPEAIRRQKLMVLIFGIGAFLAMGAVLTSILSSTLFDSSGDVEEVEVGAAARFKSFEATVRGVDCTKQSITKPDDPATSFDDTMAEKAEGKFCVVSFSVKNVGEKTDTYPTWSFEATSPTERVLDRKYTAEDYANKGSKALDEPIDPGKTADQLLVFDVPTDTTLAYLQICAVFDEPTIKVKFSS
ncbi:uncharacterized protein DUF4352 [Couchioplanes caeruleus]|nr:uncharacterized protein DUF4352 [Couchioplanes caeruleus]